MRFDLLLTRMIPSLLQYRQHRDYLAVRWGLLLRCYLCYRLGRLVQWVLVLLWGQHLLVVQWVQQNLEDLEGLEVRLGLDFLECLAHLERQWGRLGLLRLMRRQLRRLDLFRLLGRLGQLRLEFLLVQLGLRRLVRRWGRLGQYCPEYLERLLGRLDQLRLLGQLGQCRPECLELR